MYLFAVSQTNMKKNEGKLDNGMKVEEHSLRHYTVVSIVYTEATVHCSLIRLYRRLYQID